MTRQEDLKDSYEFYLSEKAKDNKDNRRLINIKFLELSLLRQCIDKLLKESEL